VPAWLIRPGVDADPAAVGDQLAEVERLARRAPTVTRKAGLAVSASCTLRPAASRISPCGE
jgi:hypothetical protein